ncbi:MAG: winged helix-turn-helix transcriptional regulator [Candidatus Thermoplasmatota archaeon]
MMKKIERVYCEILHLILEKNVRKTTQKQLSEDCKVSIGLVDYALKPLHQMGIIEIHNRYLNIINPKKLLLYWASILSLSSNIVYTTYVKESSRVIEQMMPPCIFTAYSGYRYLFNDTPADYSEVYVYGDPGIICKRFPPVQTSLRNIFVLRVDDYIVRRSVGSVAPLQLIYVDLWNLNTWYADEFIKDFEKHLKV